MFPKKARYSFKRGLPRKVLYFPTFTMRFAGNNEGLKVAVVVSRKVDNRATARNKIKRVFLDKIKSQHLKKNLDLVFYVRRQALTDQNLEKDFAEAFNKITNA